jgi:hypothetical protein
MKYRLLAANEEEGNYVLTLFAGLTVPNGSENYSLLHYSFAPALAYGKGWGDFDIQGTIGTSIPDNGGGVATGAGTPFLLNEVFQYHVVKFLWPEVEANYSYYPNGKNEGLSQLLSLQDLLSANFLSGGAWASWAEWVIKSP